MPRIAFHDPRLSHVSGGAETVTLQLIALLRAAGHDVTAVTRAAVHSQLFDEFISREQGLKVAELAIDPAHEVPPSTDERVAARVRASDRLAPESVAFNRASRPFYATHEFDLVVVSFIPDLALFPSSDPVLLNIFGLPPNEAIAELERPLIDRVSGLTFASHFIRDRFIELFPRTGTGTLGPVCHASVSAAFFSPQDEPAKTVDACYVGRLTRRKGLFTILDALAWLKNHRGRQVSLAIAGDGPEAGPLRERADTLGVAPQVQWHGAVGTDAVVPLLTRSRIFLYPTLAPEAFGCSNLEAMACGTPVVSTNLGGTSDYIHPDDNAVVCEPGSPESLGRAVERLLDDADLAARVASQGRITAWQFHPSSVASEWLRVFDTAVR